MPTLSVVFSARERFSQAARSLETLFANCPLPFQLVVVDAGTPERYRLAMLKVLEGRPNVDILRRDEYLLPNRARNLATEKATGDLILFLENDCMIRPGCVEALLAAAADEPGGVFVPWLWEKNDRHYDSGAIEVLPQPDGSLKISRETVAVPLRRERQRIHFMEHHCYLITRPALAVLGIADEELNTREAIDFSVAAWKAGIPVIIEPKAEVDFCAPPPIEKEEREYYNFRWDVPRADESHNRVASRWNIKGMPDTYGFIREQTLRKSHLTWTLIRARSFLRKLGIPFPGR